MTSHDWTHSLILHHLVHMQIVQYANKFDFIFDTCVIFKLDQLERKF